MPPDRRPLASPGAELKRMLEASCVIPDCGARQAVYLQIPNIDGRTQGVPFCTIHAEQMLAMIPDMERANQAVLAALRSWRGKKMREIKTWQEFQAHAHPAFIDAVRFGLPLTKGKCLDCGLPAVLIAREPFRPCCPDHAGFPTEIADIKK